MRTSIVRLYDDFRLRDNPALSDAFSRSDVVIPVYIWSSDGEWAPGAARRWWLHHSLSAFEASLRDRSSQLVIRAGSHEKELRKLVREVKADTVCWNECLTPGPRARDQALKEKLEADGVDVRVSSARIVHDPDQLRTITGGPYHVFTPFWKKLRERLQDVHPVPAPALGSRRAPRTWPKSVPIDDLGLLPATSWDEKVRRYWTPGEDAALARLHSFLDEDLIDYSALRERPDLDRTSRLSPYLAHGEIGIRDVWAAVEDWVQNGAMRDAADAFLRELAWREFSYHMLHHYPKTPSEPLREKFGGFQWRSDGALLEGWKQGRTGYPIVDAGMRQLRAIGWMHNRVRMITASFLTKDLRMPWQAGARWFWDTLVDADLANNTMGWQWSAGSGADAQPFFRIFNPVTQGRKHDPNGTYVRRWVPELERLGDHHIQNPWEAPEEVLEEAGVELGETYPYPVVDHRSARKEALAAYQAIK